MDDRMAALEAEFNAVEADLSDPAILSDADKLRDLSRRHKELGEIVRTWHELTSTREDVATGREMLTEASGDERELMRQEVEESEARRHALEERMEALLLPKDPNEGRNVIMEIRGAVGGDEANLFARDLYEMYLRYAAHQQVEGRGPLGGRVRQGRDQRGGVRGQGTRRLHPPRARGRHAPRPTGAGDRGQGTDPHLDGDGHRAARGRGGRGRDRSQRPQDRRLPLDRSGRAVGQHDGLGRAHHAPADRHRRGHAGREEPDPEPGQGDGGAAGPPVEGRAGPPGGRDVRPAPRSGRRRAAAPTRSAPTTTRRTGSPTTGSISPSTSSTRSWRATSAS